MSQRWILTLADPDEDYLGHIRKTSYFVNHSKAVKRAKEMLLRQHDGKEEVIEEFIAAIKDGDFVDKVAVDSNVVIRPMNFNDKDTIVDSKSLWMAYAIGDGVSWQRQRRHYFINRDNASIEAGVVLEDILEDFKAYTDDTIDVQAELKKFFKEFLQVDGDFVYHKEVRTGDFYVVVARVVFQDSN